MSQYFQDYITVGAFAALGVVLVVAILGVASVIRPSNPTKAKRLTYECGVDPVGSGWSQTYVRYYVFGLLFVVFDVEAVFVFPWAIMAEDLGMSSDSSPSSCSCSRSSKGWSTPSRRGSCDGSSAEVRGPQAGLVAAQLVPQVLAVAVPVRTRLLCHRDDGRVRAPLRLDAFRDHPAPGLAPPGGPDGRGRHRHRQDGARRQAPLRPDARSQVRDLDGLVRQLRRPLLGLLLGHQGSRPADPRRRLRTRLPAPPRGAARRHPPPAEEDPGEDIREKWNQRDHEPV
jgi:NADH-quinone oxidoreductase subunit A